MLTLKQLETFFGPGFPWEKSYPIVANEAKKFLALWEGPPLRTSDLALKICPEIPEERGDNPIGGRKLIQALTALSKHDLAGYSRMSKFDRFKLKGKDLTYRHWYGPKTAVEAAPLPPDTSAADDYWKDEQV